MIQSEQNWHTSPINCRQISTSKGAVEFADVGHGLPILYFHGTGAGNDAAVMMESSLLDGGFRLIVPNRPGYFGTPLSCNPSPIHCADLAAELLDRLDVRRVAVVGTSGGGLAAPIFAARHPERTVALVLQCCQSHPWDSGQWMPTQIRHFHLLFYYQRFCLMFLRLGMRMEMRKLRRDPSIVVRAMSGVRASEILKDPRTRALVPLLAESELRCGRQPAGIEADWAALIGAPWLTPGAVQCPTLILHDRFDPVVPFAHAEWAKMCIREARLCELHAGGHLIWVGRDRPRMEKERAEFLHRSFRIGGMRT